MNKRTNMYFLKISVIIIAAFTALSLFQLPREAVGSATSGLPATAIVATTTVVGPQVNVQLFAAQQSCTSRVVSTQAQPIMVTFYDPTNGNISSTTLTQSAGHIQSASTTVAYDSGIFGCGRMFGYAAASTTITRMEAI